MGKHVILFLFLLCVMSGAAQTGNPAVLTPVDLQCEYLSNPLGIDAHTPRFSWKLSDPAHVRGQKQSAYQVLIASNAALLQQGQADVWDSGKINSQTSTFIPFQGKRLLSNQTYYWKVQVFDKDENASGWSDVAFFTTGMLYEQDWSGSFWLKHPTAPPQKAIWFRKTFSLETQPQSGLIHVASVGYHELYINGKKADDRLLAPALTHLGKRAFYVTYDISKLLQSGKNIIALWHGSGWNLDQSFRLPSCLRVHLEAKLPDQKKITVKSDTCWRCTVSNIENTTDKTAWGNYAGECVDGRAYLPDWNTVNFDDSNWEQPKTIDPKIQLESHTIVPPTKIIETLKPVKIRGSNPYRIEFAKNFTGWVNLNMSGLVAGDTITVMTSDDDKTVCDFNQKSFYIANGNGKETFCNKFNYAAGRFITVEGLRQELKQEDAVGYVLATDLKQTGSFSCSNELFNKIYELDLWTFRANTPEGFTMDCPHRERMGYGSVSFPTGWGIGFPNYDMGAFYRKVMQDWRDVQEADGCFTNTAPQPAAWHYGGPMWCSEGLNIAREHYVNFGDNQALEKNYTSAKRWLEFLHAHAKDGLLAAYKKPTHFLGDWAAPGNRTEYGNTPQAVYFNNCVYAMNLGFFIEAAEALNRQEDVLLYKKRLADLKTSIHAKFFNTETAAYSTGNQVQQAFALSTGIVPENLKSSVVSRLHKDLVEMHPYFDMGCAGLPVLLPYLVQHPEEAEAVAKILNKTTYPGYGYFIQRGETTWPEHWEADVPSRIHTCYTGIASWFVKGLCGIQPDAAQPGYQSFIIRPMIVPEVSWAEASVHSQYGKITSRWERTGDNSDLSVTIPPNCTATVYIPAKNAAGTLITEGNNKTPLTKIKGIKIKSIEKDYIVIEAPSGQYRFSQTPKAERNCTLLPKCM